MTKHGNNYVIRQSNECKEYILKYFSLNETTGGIESKVYCSLYATIKIQNKAIAIPYSHLVWFLKYKKWPKYGLVLDHIDNNPLNNRVNNLQEITKEENAYKKRGRGNTYYGSSKYGHGITVYADKRDGRYYVTRYLSTKVTGKDKKKVKLSLFGVSTLEEAEQKIAEYVKSLDENYDALEDI